MNRIDRGFFRAMVSERVEFMGEAKEASVAEHLTMMTIEFDRLRDRLTERPIPFSTAIDSLVRLAALCERAGVELVLPKCSTRNKVDALKNSNGARGATRPTKGKL